MSHASIEYLWNHIKTTLCSAIYCAALRCLCMSQPEEKQKYDWHNHVSEDLWAERAEGREEVESAFSRSSSSFKLLSLGLSAHLSEMLKALEVE